MTRGFHSAMQKAARLASETAKKQPLNSLPFHFGPDFSFAIALIKLNPNSK